MNQTIPWHSDQSDLLSRNTDIVSVSLGCAGLFCYMPSEKAQHSDFHKSLKLGRDWHERRRAAIDSGLRGCVSLFAGDVLLLCGSFQECTQHKTLPFRPSGGASSVDLLVRAINEKYSAISTEWGCTSAYSSGARPNDGRRGSWCARIPPYRSPLQRVQWFVALSVSTCSLRSRAASNSNRPPTPRTTGASSSRDGLLFNVDAAVDAGPPSRGAGPVLQHASHPQRDNTSESDMLLAEHETFSGAFVMLPRPSIEGQVDPYTSSPVCCFRWFRLL